ncbi:hypothetical protein BGZ94_001236 [Podila epigama]|nr:hypothetical protein BGZ94_001236 [Podila epigama]
MTSSQTSSYSAQTQNQMQTQRLKQEQDQVPSPVPHMRDTGIHNPQDNDNDGNGEQPFPLADGPSLNPLVNRLLGLQNAASPAVSSSPPVVPQFHSRDTNHTDRHLTMTSGPLTSPPPSRVQPKGRRHSSAAGPLSIDTHSLSTIKRGPKTADVDAKVMTASTTGGKKIIGGEKSSRFLDPDMVVKGTARKHLKSVTGSRQDQRQERLSSNRLAIPQPQHPSSPTQMTRSQIGDISPSSPNVTSSSSEGIHALLQDRTAMALMQRYLTNPDDPDSEADIATQIMISQAAVDSKGFEILFPDTVESIKRASEHLEAAHRKVDQVATELWKLTQVAADLQRTLLQHTSGVLALGVVRLEDQNRRERESHAIQMQEVQSGREFEEQLQVEAMAKTIHELETGAMEAQQLLEEKDKAIQRLVKQLEHQREMYRKMDEQQQQQQRALSLSRSQQKLSSQAELSSRETELTNFLSLVGKRLEAVLQLQSQREQQESVPEPKKRASETTLGSKASISTTMTMAMAINTRHDSTTTTTPVALRGDSMSSMPSDSVTTSAMTVAGKAAAPPSRETRTPTSPRVTPMSFQGITSTLDALESSFAESAQKLHVLETELGLLRRHTIVMSQSRENSIRIKKAPSLSSSSSQQQQQQQQPPVARQAEDAVRAALEKSLKDALLEKEMTRQELENERHRWQEEQTHRIHALEESLVAVDDQEKMKNNRDSTGGTSSMTESEMVQLLRGQLQEAIGEIDELNQQHQQNLRDMRQLFDLIPDPRRKSHMQLLTAHQQNNGRPTSPLPSSGRSSPAGTIGFSMEALLGRVKELMARSEQLEQDNAELKDYVEAHEQAKGHRRDPSIPKEEVPTEGKTWILSSDLEKLQANAGMIHLLEKEIELLKQHTDMLLDENARLAELAANSATHIPNMTTLSGQQKGGSQGSVQKPTRDDTLEELRELIRVKDKLLQERDQLVQEQEKVIVKTQEELAKSLNSASSQAESGPMSAFDVKALEEYRTRCNRMEEETAEMKLMLAALESLHGGPGAGARLIKNSTSAASSPPQSLGGSSWFSSSVGSFSFGSLGGGNGLRNTNNNNSNSNNTGSGTSSQKASFEASHGATSGAATPTPTPMDTWSSIHTDPNNGQSNTTTGMMASPPLMPQSVNNAVAGATAALRKEFRRVMHDLRDEKEKLVRKEVEERRRLEREIRQLRRELQSSTQQTLASPPLPSSYL